MNAIVGTFECKADAKGRVMLPVALRKQLPTITESFYLKRSVYQSCLELWPHEEWMKMMERINNLNRFDPKNNLFIRKFMAGVKQVEIDDSGRLLISKDLLAFAGIQKEIVLSSQVNIVEIWDKSKYEEVVAFDEMDFATLASEVMGNNQL